MKKSLLVLLVLFTYSVMAQNKPEPGTYVSKTPSGENVKLVIGNDNKFQVAVLTGVLEHENDSIYFRSENENEPMFRIEYVKSKTKNTTIKVTLEKGSYYNYYGIHVGTQKINDTEPHYKKLKELLNVEEFDFETNETAENSFDIEKSAFLYLAKEKYGKPTSIEKYEIPEGVSEIKIGITSNLFGKLNLRGTYDTATKELTISEGKKPLTFVMEKATDLSNYIKPIESQEKRGWTYPGKEEEEIFGEAADSVSVDYDDYDDNYNAQPTYVFKLKTEKSLNEALKVAQSSPDKLLVVFYDNGKNAAQEFEKYIKRYENAVQEYMYDKYEPDQDKYNFYLATETDKNALKKMGVTEDKTIVFVNSDGTRIHHCKGGTAGYKFNYYNLKNYNDGLKLANNKAKLDKLIADKKATVPQIEKVFLGMSQDFRTTTIDYSYAPPPPPYVVNLPEKTYEVDYEATAVDTAVAVVEEVAYELPENKNTYQLKANRDVVNAKYKQLLDFNQKNKTFNENMFRIIIAELSSNGFTHDLFGKEDEAAKPIDFQSMDYLFQFYNEIGALKSEDYYFQKPSLVIDVVAAFLNNPSNAGQKEKVKEYYGKLLQASNNDPKVYKELVNYHKELKNKTELISNYENYFASYTKPNTNLIEVLDANYQLEKASNWNSYKADFAGLANTVAWFVVENSQDKTEIQKAIKWSETSLRLIVDNSYYLDTLAQLYYKNGEKEKGILWEQKAIDAARIISDSDQVATYQEVLEKMKNGKY